VDVYDPFVPGQSQLPQRTYDLVLCVEVVEHVPDPRRLFQELSTLAGDEGMVCLTTLLQPSNFAAPWTNWWYVAPRNGHVSLYTSAALGICAASVGMRGGSLNHLSHFLYRRQLPSFAARIRM
jgi:2-polyprenyl-6-hydroxyphenyl methylase/3-demethylubiquinone-9 3-methyltransferase